MGIFEKIKVWRGMGKLVDTDLGSQIYGSTAGLWNRATGGTAPKLSGEIPWTPVSKPLAKSTVALISTAGFHQAEDEPFDVDASNGDASFREIPMAIDPKALEIAHTHYPNRYAKSDPNVLLPLDHLLELASAGVINLSPRLFSFGFGGTLTKAYLSEPEGTAHQVARKLKEDGVDLALLVPA
jgi:D-proline reductase (dithiol) PrdB